MRIYLCSEKKVAVSVIIPMFNAEKYIGECLDSLLIQTFTDFEVIIVDDCSTDNSINIVEDYAPKFNGRLILTRTKTNSGGGGYIPRRIGFDMARGKYIQFLDADDFLLGSALETLYNAAQEYEAQVVYTSCYYRMNKPNDALLYRDGYAKRLLKEDIDDKTELTVDDPNKNLERLLLERDEGNFHACWSKFVRRDFLIDNKIIFPIMYNAGDFLWVINVYCHAKRFLRLPTPLYFYRRYNNSSIIRKVRPPKEQLAYWFSTFVDFANNLYELQRDNVILSQNPSYFFRTLKTHFEFCLSRINNAHKNFDNQTIYEILHHELAQNFPGLTASLLPFLFSFITNNTTFNTNSIETSSKFKNFLTARIEIKLAPNNNADLQIVSLSDDKAFVKRAGYLPKNEIGYLIHSYAGSLIIVAKSNAFAKLYIALRGVDVHPKGDNFNRIPFWIDYSKFILNGNIVFDSLTPTWHDLPFRYSVDSSPDQLFKIEVEWFPHKPDLPKPSLNDSPSRKPVAANNDSNKNLPSKFIPQLTARVDAKFVSDSPADFQILSTSDENASIDKPSWFQNNGIGFVIHSSNGALSLNAIASADGKLKINLRGMDVRSPQDWKKGVPNRIPFWIDYTFFSFNDNIIFDAITPAWCNEPYTFIADVKADQQFTISLKWLPHNS